MLDLNDNLINKVSELETIDEETLQVIKTELGNQKKLIDLIRDEKAGGSILKRLNKIKIINNEIDNINDILEKFLDLV